MSLLPPALRAHLVALRRDLHAHPELSGAEHRTCELLERALHTLATPVSVERVADTGLVARVRGRRAGAPVVALRGDIDGLPITEETGLPFASTVPGVMHACGHDVHATWAVGAAALLAERPAEGDVLIVLQPAEETGRGARAVLASGALDEAQTIFGAHVDRRFAVGEIVAVEGPVAASADTFAIDLRGRGAHAARPHEGTDPIVGAAALVLALQTIVARRLAPDDAAVVTVGLLQSGSAPNIIPASARLAGTLRAIEPSTRMRLHEELRRIAHGVAATHALTAHVEIDDGTPPLVNAPAAVAWARDAILSCLGDDALRPLGARNLGGEDFAYYLERMPGCFLRVGAREAGGEVIPAHSPRFHAAEESIAIGAAILAESARRASRAIAATASFPHPALRPGA